MNLFSASAMTMMFNEVSFDSLLGGDAEKFSQVQHNIAGRFGSLIASLGGFTPALQQMLTETMQVRYPEHVRHLVEAARFVNKNGKNLAQVRDMGGKFANHAMHVSGVSQIAASTTSAFITMCHIVADYDNAVQLAVANAKLDDLLKVHNREYRAELKSLYILMGNLFMKSVRGHIITTDLEHCSQKLDRLILIWLSEIIDQLEPVNTGTRNLKTLVRTQKSFKYWLPCLFPLPIGGPILAPGLGLLVGGPTLVGRQMYSSWLRDIKNRLNKVNSLMRLVGIAIWMNHVITYHTGPRQPLYKLYSNELQRISTIACDVKDAVIRTKKLMSVDAQIITNLGWVEKLPERIQGILTQNDFHQTLNSDPEGAKYGVKFDVSSNSFSLHAVY